MTARSDFLDPFAGSGTTGRVAQRLGRRAVLIDLSGEYLVQAMDRNREIPLSLSFSDATAGRDADPDDEPSTDAA